MAGTINGISYDIYGGYNDLDFFALGGVVLRGNAGHWRTGQIGPRVVFVTPLDHPYLIRGVFQWSPEPHTDHVVVYGAVQGQTTFAIGFSSIVTGPTDLVVTKNGSSAGFSISGTNIVLTTGANGGDQIVIRHATQSKTNTDYLTTKYGAVGHKWAKNVAKRLKLWHYNSQGQDTFTAVTDPVATTTSTSVGWNENFWDGSSNPSPFHNPWRCPSVAYADVTGQATRNSFNQMGASGAFAVKNMYCVNYDVLPKGSSNDTTNHNTIGGVIWPDVFDPLWLTNLASASVLPVGFGDDDWHHFAQIDDTDYLHFFGAAHPNETAAAYGGPVGGFPVEFNNWVAHGGIIALISQPTIVSGLDTVGGGHTYADQTNYTKAQLITWLKARYSNSISALNTAWSGPKGTPTYTSFDTDGGWRLGTGVVDEDGRSSHTWLGNAGDRFRDSSQWNPGVKTDLDDFLYEMAKQYFSTIKARLAVTSPNLLYKGPSWIGLYGAPARAGILRAVGEYLDCFGFGQSNATTIDAVTSWAMDKIGRPIAIINGVYTAANRDSSLYYLSDTYGRATQQEKAQWDAQIIESSMAAKNIGLSVYPWVGYEKWALYDAPHEARSWGLLSLKDNALDGLDHTSAAADAYDASVTIVPEDAGKVFGDFVTGITATHIAMRATMVDQFTNPPVPDPPAATAPPVASLAENFNKTESTVLGPQLAWSETTGDLRIINIFGRTQVTATLDNAYGEARATTALQTVNMRVRMLIGQLTAPASGTTRVRVCARFAAAARTYYAADYSIVANGTITAALLRVVNGSATTLTSTTSDTPSVGDTFEVEVQTVSGDCLVTMRRNSTQVLQVTDSDVAKITTGTQAGFGTGNGAGSSAYGAVDDFSAVNLDGDTTPPVAASNPTYTSALSDAVVLVWGAASDSAGINYYEVFRNGTSIATTSSLTYTDTSVAASTYYKYIIRAFDNTGWATDGTAIRLTTSADASTDVGPVAGALVGAFGAL